MRNQISVKQFGILASVILFADKLIILPSLVFMRSGFGSFVTIVLLFLFDLLLFYFLIKLKEKFQKSTLFQVLSKKFGVAITIIVFFLIFIYLFMRFMVLINENYSLLRGLVYDDATFLKYIICLLPVINAFVFFGLRSLSRTAEFYYFMILVGIVICIATGVFSANFSMPTIKIESSSFSSFFYFLFWFGDAFLLLMLIDKIKLENNYGKKIMRYLLLSSGLLISIYFVFLGLHDVTAFMYKGAIADIIQFSFISTSVGKIDIVAVLTKTFLVYFQCGVIFYAMKECLKILIPKSNEYSCIAVIDFLVLFVQYAFVLTFNSYVVLAKSTFNIYSIIMYLIVILLFSIAYFKKPQKKVFAHAKN